MNWAITSVAPPRGMKVPKNICGMMKMKLIPVADSADFEMAAAIRPNPTATNENATAITNVKAIPAIPLAGLYPIK